jgi:hypothetical protein
MQNDGGDDNDVYKLKPQSAGSFEFQKLYTTLSKIEFEFYSIDGQLFIITSGFSSIKFGDWEIFTNKAMQVETCKYDL